MSTLQVIDYKKNCFDFIRIIAALQVMFGHFVEHFELNVNFIGFDFFEKVFSYVPGKGVIIFFVISGFFVFPSLEKGTWINYLKKKFIRIFPELWLAFAVNTGLIILLYGMADSVIDNIIYFFTQLTIFQFYTGDWLREYGVGTPNGALWTISVTIQFYLSALVLYRVSKKWSLKDWVILLVSSIIIAIFCSNLIFLPTTVYKLIIVSIVPYYYIFVIGIICYIYKDKIIPFIRKRVVIFFIIYIVCKFLYMNFFNNLRLGINYDVISTVFLSMTVIGVAFCFEKRIKYEITYEIFIWHMIICNVFIQFSKSKDLLLSKYGILFMMLSSLIVIMISICSFFLEKKLIRLIEKKE